MKTYITLAACLVVSCIHTSEPEPPAQPPVRVSNPEPPTDVSKTKPPARVSAGHATDGGPPAWITRGSGLVDGETKMFVGVGSCNGSSPPVLLAATARNRARNRVMQLLEVYVATAVKPWVAAAPSTENLLVAHAIHSWVRPGSTHIADAADYRDDETGTSFALAKLELSDVIAVYERTPELEPVRAHYGSDRKPLIELFNAQLE